MPCCPHRPWPLPCHPELLCALLGLLPEQESLAQEHLATEVQNQRLVNEQNSALKIVDAFVTHTVGGSKAVRGFPFPFS